ncbi:MAG: LamG domain-containing protein, partial [Chitinophagaceae bacterium]
PAPSAPNITANGPTSFCSNVANTTSLSYQSSKYLDFNGYSSYAVASTNSTPNFSSAYTVESWININAYQYGTFVAKWEDEGDNRSWMINMGETGGSTICVVQTQTGSWSNAHIQWNTGFTPSLNTWYHMAVVFNSSTIKLFINGNEVASTPWTYAVPQTNAKLLIGGYSYFNLANGGANSRFLNGKMKDIRLWNVARTQSQIAASMNTAVPTNSSGLVSYYNLAAGSGSTLIDATSNNNNLYMNNITWVSNSFSSYLWSPGGATTTSIVPTTSGSYTLTGIDAITGCTATSAPITFTINQVTSSTKTVLTANSSYTWNGVTYIANGTYNKTGLTNSKGCDSTATLILTLNASCTNSATTINLAVCPSQLPYLWNGMNLLGVGTYIYSLPNTQGCDSVVTFHLSLKTNTTSTTNIAICPSQLPYNWNGSRTAAGTYTFTTTNSQGCDSVATLNLSLKTNTTSATNISICPSQLPYNWNGSRAAAGTYIYTTTNAQGCDSTATLVLTLKTAPATPTVTTNGATSFCSGGSVG